MGVQITFDLVQLDCQTMQKRLKIIIAVVIVNIIIVNIIIVTIIIIIVIIMGNRALKGSRQCLGCVR